MPLQALPLPPVGYRAPLLLRVPPPLKPPGIHATTSPPSTRRFLVPLWLSPGALQPDELYSVIKIAFSFSPVSQIEKSIWLSVSVLCRLPPASTAKRTMVLGTNACLWLVSWLGPVPIATMVERALGAHFVPVSFILNFNNFGSHTGDIRVTYKEYS